MARSKPPERLTPVMQQFWAAKQAYPDCVLLFRMGDFYETFYDDAVTVSRELDLTLTARDRKGADGGIPMAGAPHHAIEGYVARLVERGYKVAICDQVEDPSKAKGLVRREVTRVITPGVVLDSSSLAAQQANYLLGVAGSGPFGVAYLDISTGEFLASEAADAYQLAEELVRVEPREVRLSEATRTALGPGSEGRGAWLLDTVPADDIPSARTVERLLGDGHWAAPGADELGGGLAHGRAITSFGFVSPKVVSEAAGLELEYIERTQKRVWEHVRPVRCYSLSSTMVLDETTLANLELTRTLMGGRRQGSLLGLLDRTRTAMGARLLRRWLMYPLLQPEAISRRHDAVDDLCRAAALREELGAALQGLGDLERLAGRLASGIVTPRELKALERGVLRLPAVRRLLLADQTLQASLRELAEGLDELADVAARVGGAIVDEPPAHVRDGGVLRRGFHGELDEILTLSGEGRDWIAKLEVAERERTGIASLKIRYNKVFGYFLEVTRPNLPLVPDHYVRKQTLANAERYYTPELKEWEDRVLSADDRRVALEGELYVALVEELGGAVERIQDAAATLAELDVYVGLADLALLRGYVRPVVDASRRIEIEDGRHPVVEVLVGAPFVPNSIELDATEAQILIITGPNMAGKSTVMRQAALIVLMAQMGSFVPARRAHVGIVDRIFARVGASDNLAQGRSTFMVEMTETASILTHATGRSLLVLDEIGRGTSTFDGVSIAWAVAEHLHDHVGARTLFATHYHELTELAITRERVRNLSVAVKEWQDEVIFLRKLVPGATGRSYGIQVARLAGLPSAVIERAKEVLGNLEASQLDATSRPVLSRQRGEQVAEPQPAQLNLFAPLPLPSRIEQSIRSLDPDQLSPRAALELLYRFREELEGR